MVQMNKASTLFTNTNYISLSLSTVLVMLLKAGMHMPQLHSSELLEDVFRRMQGGLTFSQRFLPDAESLRIVHIPKRMHSSSKKTFYIELVPEEDRINTTTKTAFIASIKITVILCSNKLVASLLEPSISYIRNWSLYVFPRIIW